MAPGVRTLSDFLTDHRSIVVLSGAGVSTPSGIPDYRDRDGEWKYSQPIQYTEFMGKETSRKRYWARSYIGWKRFSKARPNAAHQALAKLEGAGKVDLLITQNVDRLHTDAGSKRVIDLHGDLRKVRCMSCETRTARSDYQDALAQANPGFDSEVSQIRADGDAELVNEATDGFTVPECDACGGIVKPDVVMFGESVPRERVDAGMEAVEQADAMLVVGSSLMVFSGFRFARRVGELGKPLAILNRGRTRADELAELRIDEDCAEVLPAAIEALDG